MGHKLWAFHNFKTYKLLFVTQNVTNVFDQKFSLNGVRVLFAEFFGTFILTVIGIGTAFSASELGPLAGGIGVMLGIYYAANASGGHVNPAVTSNLYHLFQTLTSHFLVGFWIQGRLSDSFLRGTILLLIYWA